MQPNFRLTEHCSMRRAQQCRIPHAVCRRCEHHSRLTIVRRGCERQRLAEASWRSHVHRTRTAQRVQSFKNKTRNVGGRGGLPSSFLLGFQRGHSLSRKRMAPLTRPLHGAGTEAALSGSKISARWRARKKRSTPAGAPFLHSPKSRTTLSQRSWSVS